MIDAAWLASTLRDVPEKIVAWREQAEQLKHLVTAAQVGGTVSDDLLSTTEQTCTAIYEEINKTAEVIDSVANASPSAASELAPLSDALHLVLLEVTELSTELYGMRSRLAKPMASLLAST